MPENFKSVSRAIYFIPSFQLQSCVSKLKQWGRTMRMERGELRWTISLSVKFEIISTNCMNLELMKKIVRRFLDTAIHRIIKPRSSIRHGSRGGEMGEFSIPFFWAPFFLFFSYPSNIEIIFDFSDFSDWGGENSPPISKSWICTWVYKYGQNKLCYPINSGLYGELCYLPSE